MATVELTNETWRDFSKADYALIDCYGDECTACVILEPVYDGVADELFEIPFGRINISSDFEIANEYGIDAMPTILYFRKGELIFSTAGSIDREELMRNVSKLLYR